MSEYPAMVIICEVLSYQVMAVIFECVCDIMLSYHVCDSTTYMMDRLNQIMRQFWHEKSCREQ